MERKKIQKKDGLKLVKTYVSEETKRKLEELSEEERKSISFIVSELITNKLETIIKLDLEIESDK